MFNDAASQVYVAGYVFGYLTKLAEVAKSKGKNVPDLDEPSRFDMASRQPLKGLAVGVQFIHQWHIRADEDLMTSLITELDDDVLPKHLDLSQQSIWFLGFFAGKTPNLNKLAIQRKLKKLSQTQLAELSGIPVRSIKAYEIGERKLASAQAETVATLAKALECTVEDLI